MACVSVSDGVQIMLERNTINRLSMVNQGETLDTQVCLLLDFAEKHAYEFYNIPVSSRPRHRRLGTIPIGGSRRYQVPLVDVHQFTQSTYSYGSRYKMRFHVDSVSTLMPVVTVTVTRIA